MGSSCMIMPTDMVGWLRAQVTDVATFACSTALPELLSVLEVFWDLRALFLKVNGRQAVSFFVEHHQAVLCLCPSLT